jgi:hypothetical protein
MLRVQGEISFEFFKLPSFFCHVPEELIQLRHQTMNYESTIFKTVDFVKSLKENITQCYHTFNVTSKMLSDSKDETILYGKVALQFKTLYEQKTIEYDNQVTTLNEKFSKVVKDSQRAFSEAENRLNGFQKTIDTHEKLNSKLQNENSQLKKAKGDSENLNILLGGIIGFYVIWKIWRKWIGVVIFFMLAGYFIFTTGVDSHSIFNENSTTQTIQFNSAKEISTFVVKADSIQFPVSKSSLDMKTSKTTVKESFSPNVAQDQLEPSKDSISFRLNHSNQEYKHRNSASKMNPISFSMVQLNLTSIFPLHPS